MKSTVVKSIIILLGVSVLMSFQPKTNKLPSLNVTDLKGNKLDIAQYAKNGKVTVISFWATWCKPCVKELNAINEYYEDWKSEFDFEVLAVSIDDARTKAKVPAYVKATGWPFDIVIDEAGASKRAFNYQNPPYMVVVDKNGDIAYKHSGYLTGDEDDLYEHLLEITGK